MQWPHFYRERSLSYICAEDSFVSLVENGSTPLHVSPGEHMSLHEPREGTSLHYYSAKLNHIALIMSGHENEHDILLGFVTVCHAQIESKTAVNGLLFSYSVPSPYRIYSIFCKSTYIKTNKQVGQNTILLCTNLP